MISYTTDGAVEISSKLNSLVNLSLMISICNKPKNPHLKPKPNAAEVSASKLNDESFKDNFSNASLRSLKSALSVGKRPQKTTGIEGLKPSNIEFVGFLSSVIVSPTLQSAIVLTEAVKKPISPGPIESTFNILGVKIPKLSTV